jgi:hypothetical protein
MRERRETTRLSRGNLRIHQKVYNNRIQTKTQEKTKEFTTEDLQQNPTTLKKNLGIYRNKIKNQPLQTYKGKRSRILRRVVM